MKQLLIFRLVEMLFQTISRLSDTGTTRILNYDLVIWCLLLLLVYVLVLPVETIDFNLILEQFIDLVHENALTLRHFILDVHYLLAY